MNVMEKAKEVSYSLGKGRLKTKPLSSKTKLVLSQRFLAIYRELA